MSSFHNTINSNTYETQGELHTLGYLKDFYRKWSIISFLKQNVVWICSPRILSVLKEAWTTRKWGTHSRETSPRNERTIIKRAISSQLRNRSRIGEYHVSHCSEYLRDGWRVKTEGGYASRCDRTNGAPR